MLTKQYWREIGDTPIDDLLNEIPLLLYRLGSALIYAQLFLSLVASTLDGHYYGVAVIALMGMVGAWILGSFYLSLRKQGGIPRLRQHPTSDWFVWLHWKFCPLCRLTWKRLLS